MVIRRFTRLLAGLVLFLLLLSSGVQAQVTGSWDTTGQTTEGRPTQTSLEPEGDAAFKDTSPSLFRVVFVITMKVLIVGVVIHAFVIGLRDSRGAFASGSSRKTRMLRAGVEFPGTSSGGGGRRDFSGTGRQFGIPGGAGSW